MMMMLLEALRLGEGWGRVGLETLRTIISEDTGTYVIVAYHAYLIAATVYQYSQRRHLL